MSAVAVHRSLQIACHTFHCSPLQEAMNVIAVDWRQGAKFPYTQATANIRVVAMEIVKLIEFMQTEYPAVKAGDIHLIGHSLGAHASGEVGTKIKGIGRISGQCVLSRPCCAFVPMMGQFLIN